MKFLKYKSIQRRKAIMIQGDLDLVDVSQSFGFLPNTSFTTWIHIGVDLGDYKTLR